MIRRVSVLRAWIRRGGASRIRTEPVPVVRRTMHQSAIETHERNERDNSHTSIWTSRFEQLLGAYPCRYRYTHSDETHNG